MDSNFKVICPFCSKENDFIGDNWHDELIDDSDHSHIDCMKCDFPMEIITHATYKLEVSNTDIESLDSSIDEQQEY